MKENISFGTALFNCFKSNDPYDQIEALTTLISTFSEPEPIKNEQADILEFKKCADL